MNRPLGNTELVEYGIQNEDSDLRVHVCPTVRRMYIYSTSAGVAAIETGKYEKAAANTLVDGAWIKTAEGYLVPPDDIDGCVNVTIPEWMAAHFSKDSSTTRKGALATRLVQRFCKEGWFPLPAGAIPVDDHRMQVSGIDLIIIGDRVKIQVKCDFRGGPRELGGTGNLFLQVAECNPLRQV